MIDEAVDRMDGLSLLVNNAATQTPVSFTGTISEEEVRDSLDDVAIGLQAPVALTALAMPHLTAHDEAGVAFIPSALGFAPKQSTPAYCAAKAGLNAFALSLRYQWELSSTRISSFTVLLPLVDTGMTQGRGGRKISPDAAAQRTVREIERGKEDIVIRPVGVLRMLHRLSPSMAGRITRNQ